MGVRVSRTRSFQASVALLRHALRYALRSCGGQKQLWSDDGRRVSTRIASGFWSWGEDIDATIYNDGIVLVESSCVTKTQILDWGKNDRNIENIFNSVEEYLKDTSFTETDGHSREDPNSSKQHQSSDNDVPLGNG